MARPGYLSLRITPNRACWLDAICQRIRLEPNSKGYQQAIDYALMRVVREEGGVIMIRTARVRETDHHATGMVSFDVIVQTTGTTGSYIESEHWTRAEAEARALVVVGRVVGLHNLYTAGPV